MEYRILKYFLTVAREENITRAADILHISQPALSRQMMQLEEELGAQLFVRGRHSTTLTEDGMLLRRRAQEIVELTEKTEREFLTGKEEIGGTISIGSGEGSRTFVLLGEHDNVLRAWKGVAALKGAALSGAPESMITCVGGCASCVRHTGCVYKYNAENGLPQYPNDCI